MTDALPALRAPVSPFVGLARRMMRPLNLFAVFLVVAALLLPWGRLLEGDAAAFAVMARLWGEGMVPYRDVFESKPPVLFMLTGMAELTGGLVGLSISDSVRLLSAGSVALAGVAMTGLVRACGVRSAISFVIGLSTVVLLAAPAFANGGGLSEPPALALGLSAWLLAEHHRPGPVRLLVIGILAAAAVGTSLFAAAFAVGAMMALWAHAESARMALGRIALMVTGSALVGLPVFVYFVSQGALEALWRYVVVYNRAYGAIICPQANSTRWPCFDGVDKGQVFIPYGLVILPFLAASILTLRAARPSGRALRLFAVLAIAATTTMAPLLRSPSDHYFWPLLLGLSAPAALGLDWLVTKLRSKPSFPMRATAGMLIILMALGATGLFVAGRRIEPAKVDNERYLAQLATILDAIPNDAPLLVWGVNSSEYLITERAPAGGNVHIFTLLLPGFSNAERFEEACLVMVRTRPVIIDDAADLSLRVDASTPGGIDPAWVAPVRNLVARDWVVVRESQDSSSRILAPKPDGVFDEASCS